MILTQLGVVLAILIALVAPGRAALIQADLFAPGDGLLTQDTDTALEWLDVDQTLGLSFPVGRTLSSRGASMTLRTTSRARAFTMSDRAPALRVSRWGVGSFRNKGN